MSLILGDYPINATIQFKWSTNGQDGSSITRSTDGTLKIYKGSSNTERTTLAGVTQTEDFAATTGIHHVTIDLSDNTDAGFYAAGNEYQVVMSGMVIDTKTVNAPIAQFSIERSGGNLALLKDATFGLSALKTLTDDLESRLTATRAGYLDNLSAGAVALSSQVDALEGDSTAIKAKTDNLPGSPAAVGSAMTLTSGERDSTATALLDLASAVDGKTVRQALRIISALAGILSGAGSGTETFKGLDGSTSRIVATVDVDGNRTAVSFP